MSKTNQFILMKHKIYICFENSSLFWSFQVWGARGAHNIFLVFNNKDLKFMSKSNYYITFFLFLSIRSWNSCQKVISTYLRVIRIILVLKIHQNFEVFKFGLHGARITFSFFSTVWTWNSCHKVISRHLWIIRIILVLKIHQHFEVFKFGVHGVRITFSLF